MNQEIYTVRIERYVQNKLFTDLQYRHKICKRVVTGFIETGFYCQNCDMELAK
jgi:hypothetical protein